MVRCLHKEQLVSTKVEFDLRFCLQLLLNMLSLEHQCRLSPIPSYFVGLPTHGDDLEYVALLFMQLLLNV